ncbi:MAG: ArnT family glycosyltransferase, partial [Tangfeifania sp.]
MKIQTKNILWGFAFLMIGMAWIFGLFIDLTGDSGLHAAISRQMVESGDWLNLKINGEPYDQKPHLLFWLAGLGIELFGNSNFAFKLFPFLFALSSLWFVYKLAKLLFSHEAGLTAALVAGTSQMFFLYLLDIHTDTILQAGVALALWQLMAYLEKRKFVHFIWGFVGIGLAMLAKGPIGAVLPFFTVLFYLLIKKDFRRLFHPKWILGILIVLAVISPTLWHLFESFGWEGIRVYFITNNLGRITG